MRDYFGTRRDNRKARICLYGKVGSKISEKMIKEIMASDSLRILLIRSGKAERYWAEVKEIQYGVPEKEAIPEYYRDTAGTFKTWFKIEKFVLADKDVMSKCVVASSGKILGEASKHSMRPYFIINAPTG